MSKVILGHPYSGALYAYFNDEIASLSSAGRARFNAYYKTLYGKDFEKYTELALTFLMLYDEVWLTPADNPLPRSSLSSDSHTRVPELGLYFDNDLFERITSLPNQEFSRYLLDPSIQRILDGLMRLPRHSWLSVVTTARFEADLSVQERCPLLCSYSKRLLIERMIEIDNPSQHPRVPSSHNVEFIENYRDLMGMALAPKSSDQLMLAKPDLKVREYAGKFLAVALSASSGDDAVDRQAVARLLLDAMETESIAKHGVGILHWAGTFARLAHEPILAAVAGAGSFATNYFGNQAGWYNFKGSIDKAIDEPTLLIKIKEIVRQSENESAVLKN